MKKATIAIVGRPNVGKSTLFNRLVGKRQAIVHDLPGITRDRLYGEGAYWGRRFTLIDTGGLESVGDDALFREVKRQAEFAISQADLIILLLDIRSGILPKDRQLSEMLRKSGKPVVLALNKADTPKLFPAAGEFFSLGMGEPVTIAAEHGIGIGDLMERLFEVLPEWEEDQTTKGPPAVRIAVIGRPNVGKSSFINGVLKDERVVVSEIPGTTRDPVDINFNYGNREYIFTDTAGIRRKGKVKQAVEKFSVVKALQSLKGADIALVLVDASEGICDQDLTIAGYAEKEGCGVIILVNKWDLIKEESRKKSTEYVKNRFRFLAYAPVEYISALKGDGITKVLDTLPAVYAQYSKRVPTPDLNRLLKECLDSHPPSMVKGTRLKIYYITQPQTCPPSFLLFMNRKQALHFSYIRFLKNQIRERFGFEGTPIKLIIRGRKQKGNE